MSATQQGSQVTHSSKEGQVSQSPPISNTGGENATTLKKLCSGLDSLYIGYTGSVREDLREKLRRLKEHANQETAVIDLVRGSLGRSQD